MGPPHGDSWQSEKRRGIRRWLSEVNPNIWEGECSGDPTVYEDFLEFLSKQDYESLSVSQIAKLYFAQLDDYYAPTIMRKVKIIKIQDNAKCIA